MISSERYGGRRSLPYVFTEQGVAMLSSVLNSKAAIKANIEIMRTFVDLRSLASTYKEIESKSDKNYQVLVEAFLQLKEQVEPSLSKSRKKIGIQKI